MGVVMAQMSGQRHVRIGIVAWVSGNVLMIHSASLTHGCVMGTHGGMVIVVMDQMNGSRHVRTGNVPKAGGNVQIV